MIKKGIFLFIISIILPLLASCSQQHTAVTALHINSKTVRLESDMTKNLSITAHPEGIDSSHYSLVSENEFVAVCKGNSVCAVNEGETYVYAVSTNGKIESNKVKVIVSNEIFDVASKIIALSVEEEIEELKMTEITPEKATQIAETRIYEIPEKFTPPLITEDNASDTVYITQSGTKFHKKTCSYAKNASPVSRSEAYDDGKTPCKKCCP